VENQVPTIDCRACDLSDCSWTNCWQTHSKTSFGK